MTVVDRPAAPQPPPPPSGSAAGSRRGRSGRHWRALGQWRARTAGAEQSPGSVVLSSAAMMLGAVCLWMLAQLIVLGSLSQERAQDVLYDRFRVELAAATAPIGPVVPVGDPVALLTIPTLGLQQVVVEGTASGDLLVGPGHRRDTVLPGQRGVSVVYGRAVSYGAPFADVGDLVPGDVLEVTAAQGSTIFTVLGVRRAGDPLPQPLADGAARLTLVSAEGGSTWGIRAPDSVVYVDAEAPEGFPAPAGATSAAPDSEAPMASDSSALPLVALCLALLMGLTLAVIAARQRLGVVQVWLLAAPVALALSWFTTDAVMRLLPNLI